MDETLPELDASHSREPQAPLQRSLNVGRFDALNDRSLLFVVPGVLDPATCRAHVGRIEQQRPLRTEQRDGVRVVRRNKRAIVMDPELAADIFAAVRPNVPDVLVQMAPSGANECIRYYRYDAGDFFRPHQDTHFMRGPKERSLLSVVVYLNDDFEGGEVDFPDAGRTIQPAPGRAVVFGHRMVHESRPILSGTKYALRSDVMYRALE